MNKLFSFYCVAVLAGFLWATTNGYAMSSLFSNQRHGGRGSGTTWIHTYHK